AGMRDTSRTAVQTRALPICFALTACGGPWLSSAPLCKHSADFHVAYPRPAPRDQCEEDTLAAVEFAEHGIGECDFVTVADKRKFDEALGARDREIAKEQSVDKTEDGGVGAYAQG